MTNDNLKKELRTIRLGFEPCPTCQGTGRVPAAEIYGEGAKGLATCYSCTGGGVVNVAKADSIRAFNEKNGQ